jgi:hypothetical protein
MLIAAATRVVIAVVESTLILGLYFFESYY